MLKLRKFKLKPEWRTAWITTIWVLIFLCVFDVTANLLFPFPKDPLVQASTLSNYFEYGRSIEGKLRHMLGPDDASSSLVAQAGWLTPQKWQDQPKQAPAGKNLLVAIYGQSFAQQVGQEMVKLDPKISTRMLAGPSAPPNYAYAAYDIDRGAHKADVVMLGLLASSVRAMRTLNGMTWQFEGPAPYSYPRYQLENNQLRATWPQERSLSELRQTLNNPQAWQRYLATLKAHDGYFTPFLFEQSIFDHSVLVRMFRRAWAQRYQEGLGKQVYNSQTGFNSEQEVPVLRALVSEFAKSAKQAGQLPIVLIFNDQKYSDHLYQAIKPTLEAEAIPFVSTHELAPPTDIRNFVPDGHFVESANQKFAQAALALINEKIPQRRASAVPAEATPAG